MHLRSADSHGYPIPIISDTIEYSLNVWGYLKTNQKNIKKKLQNTLESARVIQAILNEKCIIQEE